MKLLIIRHGDPDYAIDGLTEAGKREAEAGFAEAEEKEYVAALLAVVRLLAFCGAPFLMPFIFTFF